MFRKTLCFVIIVIIYEISESATTILRNFMKHPKPLQNNDIKEQCSPVSYNLPVAIIAWIGDEATKAGHKSRSEWLSNLLKKIQKSNVY